MDKFYCVIYEIPELCFKFPDLKSAKEVAAEMAKAKGEGTKLYVLEKIAECEVPKTSVVWT